MLKDAAEPASSTPAADSTLRRIARVWLHRERIEYEAAEQFRRLSRDLASVGAHPAVIALARKAADDEVEHAARCRRLVDRLAPEPLAPLAPMHAQLGPSDLTTRERALYAAVSMGCVTETLSVALLLRMRERARHPEVRDTIDTIAKDEIDHGRLGWAQLAAEAERGDVSWLGRYVGPMLMGAVVTEVEPMSEWVDATAFGILSPHEVRDVVAEVVTRVIVPGLERFAIDAGATRAHLARWCASRPGSGPERR